MLEGLEEGFIQLQGNTLLFITESFACLYLMLSQGVIADKFLMMSLENIS